MGTGSPTTATAEQARTIGLPATGPITLTVDGHTYEADLPADWWLAVLARCDWPSITTEVYPVSDVRLDDVEDPYDAGDVAAIARGIAESVTGMSWPMACRLAATAVADWPVFAAWCASHTGFDPLEVRIHRTLAAVYAAMREGCEKEKDVVRLDRQIKSARGIPGQPRPRPGRPETAPWSPAQEAAAARAAMAQLGALGLAG